MPVISGLTYTVTESTIVAVWTTDVSSDSNLFAGSKAAIDNGLAASGTSHQCVVTGLLPNTSYACHVTSGGTSSSTQNVTTSKAPTRSIVAAGSMGSVTSVAGAPIGDTYHTFVSSDNNTYMTQDDGKGFVNGSPQATGYNTQIGLITSETTMAGTFVSLANYGSFNSTNGTDGPLTDAMTNKNAGLFGLNGNLHLFVYRQYPPSYTTNRYVNVIKSTNHGSTWNNFNQPSTFTAGGNVLTPQSPSEPVQFYSNLVGKVCPVLYAADDGTLGYLTAGQQIDGANAYVYCHYYQDAATSLYLMRIPRIALDNQNLTFEYWVGSASPAVADFTNDANWSSTEGSETALLSLDNSWSQAAFIPVINSYLLTTWTDSTIFQFYSAPTPAGPWKMFFRQVNSTFPDQWYSPLPFHRDCLSNTLTTSIPVKIIYQGNSSGADYFPHWSTLTMLTSNMVQIVSYGFTTVENPLSNGGNFTTVPSQSALKVISSGVCEPASVAACGAYWSGAVPSGDTGGTWPADQYAEVKILFCLSNVSQTILRVRQSSGANTGYQIGIPASTGSPAPAACSIFSVVAGTATQIGSSFNITVAAGDTIRFAVIGQGSSTVLSTYQNGTLIDNRTDATGAIAGPGNPAFILVPNAAITNVQASSFAAGANQAASPTFSPPGGSYSGTKTVTLTGPAGSTIYYTTDGSTPTRSSSSVATGGTVSITPPKTLKAIASVSNFVDSPVSNTQFSKVSTTHQQLRLKREGRR